MAWPVFISHFLYSFFSMDKCCNILQYDSCLHDKSLTASGACEEGKMTISDRYVQASFYHSHDDGTAGGQLFELLNKSKRMSAQMWHQRWGGDRFANDIFMKLSVTCHDQCHPGLNNHLFTWPLRPPHSNRTKHVCGLIQIVQSF